MWPIMVGRTRLVGNKSVLGSEVVYRSVFDDNLKNGKAHEFRTSIFINISLLNRFRLSLSQNRQLSILMITKGSKNIIIVLYWMLLDGIGWFQNTFELLKIVFERHSSEN